LSQLQLSIIFSHNSDVYPQVFVDEASHKENITTTTTTTTTLSAFDSSASYRQKVLHSETKV
jgi:hypothetical protein